MGQDERRIGHESPQGLDRVAAVGIAGHVEVDIEGAGAHRENLEDIARIIAGQVDAAATRRRALPVIADQIDAAIHGPRAHGGVVIGGEGAAAGRGGEIAVGDRGHRMRGRQAGDGCGGKGRQECLAHGGQGLPIRMGLSSCLVCQHSHEKSGFPTISVNFPARKEAGGAKSMKYQ